MADTSQGSFKGTAPKADTSPQAKMEDEHCPHCAEHHGRLSAIEARLGMKPQPGVAKEESGEHKEKTPKYERKRH